MTDETDPPNTADEAETVGLDSSTTPKRKKKSKKSKKSPAGDVEQPLPQDDLREGHSSSNGGMTTETDTMDALLDKKSSSELSASLSPTIYSIIYVCSAKSKAFYMALFVFCFQVAFPTVVLMDLIDSSASGANSTFSIPAGINIEVRIAGFLSLALAVPYFSDTLDAIEKLQEGYDPIVTKQSPHATRAKWLLAAILQLCIGLLFNFTIFILVIQSSTVIGMFLNFAALAFITEIDEVAFTLASKGYFTEDIQESTGVVERFETPNAHNFLFKRLFLVGTTLAFLAGYGRIASQQNSGTWLCKRIEVQFGDAYYSQAPYYSGMYQRSSEILSDGRFYYLSEDGKGAAFRYCSENGASNWVWGELGETGVGEITVDNLCDDANWLARSPTTKGFELADITAVPPSSWVISTSVNSEIVYPIDHFVLRCADCAASNCEGYCDDNVCQCFEYQFGSQCTFYTTEICPVLDKDPITNDFPQDDTSLLEATYVTLLDREGDPVLAYGKPVYYHAYDDGSGTITFADVLVFMGHRYFAGFVNDALASEFSLEEFTLALVDLFSTFHYLTYYELERDETYPLELQFAFASDPLDIGQSSDQITPTDKRWFKISSLPDSTLDYKIGAIDVGTVLICAGAACYSGAGSGSDENPCPSIEGSDTNFCRNIQDYEFEWAIFSNSTVGGNYTEYCDCGGYSLAKDAIDSAEDGDSYVPGIYYGPTCSSVRLVTDPEELVNSGLRTMDALIGGIIANNSP